MRRAVLLLLGACALASCGKPPETVRDNGASAAIVDAPADESNAANAVANVAGPVKGGDDDKVAIQGVIDRIYAAYATPSGPLSDPPVSPDFKGALAAGGGGADRFGYDPWCDCQDFDAAGFRYEVKGVAFAPDGDHARATVALGLGFEGGKPVRKWIDFVRTSRGWLVDDLSDPGHASFKEQLRSVPVEGDNEAG